MTSKSEVKFFGNGSKVCVALEQRYFHDAEGSYYTDSVHDNEFFLRYADVFNLVNVVARSRFLHDKAVGLKHVNLGPVSFFPVTDYRGFGGLVHYWHAVDKQIRYAVMQSDAVVARVPGHIGSRAIYWARKYRKNYGLEVVGDPWEAMRYVSINEPVRSLLRFKSWSQLRKQCRDAPGVSYVTEKYLQKRYPSLPGKITTSYSSVNIPDDLSVRTPPLFDCPPLRLICVAGMDQSYKGHDILLASVKACRSQGVDLTLQLIGDGARRKQYESMNANMGLSDVVKFRGQIANSTEIYEALSKSHLLILASRTEGLPRVIIEAMAVGLPCIASNVGGCSDLLPETCLFRAGDSSAITKKILELVQKPEHLVAMREYSLKKSQEYKQSVLAKKRQVFYRQLNQG